MFSNLHIKTLANVVPEGEPIATPSHCSKKFPSNMKNESNMVILSKYKRNFLWNCQHMFDFCKGFVHKDLTFLLEVCWWKMKISKLAVKSEASISKTFWANETESFIVYSLFVSGLSNWSQNVVSL